MYLLAPFDVKDWSIALIINNLRKVISFQRLDGIISNFISVDVDDKLLKDSI